MDLIVLLFISFAAAFLGTVVMTVGQEVEMRISRRPISYTPAIAVFKIFRLNFEQLSQWMKIAASYTVHFAYGTAWGFPLAFFYLFDFIEFTPVLVSYFLIIWIQGLVVVPLLGIAGPPWTWGFKAILTEMVHKAVLAVSTVLIFQYFISLV
jgi:hypothetical protein|tara:strand:- start:50477 stop:50932 length:456 start_codon:yes stop_codon:yes gene_type:complete